QREKEKHESYSSHTIRMVKAKIKPLLPSLREKKRYLVYEVVSGNRFNDALHVNKSILEAAKEFLGNLGMARAGIITMNDQWNADMQRGIIRVNNRHVDDLKASLVFAGSIDGKETIVRSIGASGILKKARQKYLYTAK
ncbi:MAG: Rpp14/Pop5 family protein, partial [Nanoarchaeota archaeon]